MLFFVLCCFAFKQIWPLASKISWEKKENNLERAIYLSCSDYYEDSLCLTHAHNLQVYQTNHTGPKVLLVGSRRNTSILKY